MQTVHGSLRRAASQGIVDACLLGGCVSRTLRLLGVDVHW